MAALKIKLGVVTKPGSAQNIAAEKFKELIEQRAKGKVKVKIFHSASLGNETEILQQLSRNKSLAPGSRDYDIALEQLFNKKFGNPQK